MARGARLLSFFAFMSTLAIYSPNVMVVQAFDGADLTGSFAEPCLTVAFLACALAFAYSATRNALPRIACLGAVWTVGMLLYAFGCAGFILTVALQPAWGAVANNCFSVCAGLGVLPVCLGWAWSLSDFDLGRAVVLVALAVGLSAPCTAMLMGAPSTIAAPVLLALLCAGLAWPSVALLRRRGAGMSHREREACEGVEIDDRGACGNASDRMNLRAFCSVMGVPLIGMSISSFAMGVQPVFLFGGTLDAQRLGMVLGAVALLLFSSFKERRPALSFLYQAYLPLVAAIVIVLCSFPADTWVRDVGLAAAYALYAMVGGVGIAAAIAVTNAREFSRGAVVSSLVGVFCGTAILGVLLGGHVGGLVSNNPAVLIVMTALYGAGLLLAGSFKSWRMVNATADDGVPAAKPADRGGETFDERLARLAVQACLSPRETEIASYVGRGHSSVYVAKTLLISESTVYSHVRNIYRKFGVAGREELIQMLGDREDA